MTNRRRKGGSSDIFPLLGLQNHCGGWLQLWNQKTIASWQENDDKPRQCVEKQKHYSVDKGPYSQGYGLPSGHIWLSELDWKEGRAPKNWCLGTVALRLPWTARRSNQSILKKNQSWIFLEGLTLKLNFGHLIWSPNFGHLIRRANSLEKSMMVGKIEGRRRGRPRMR